MYKTEGRHVLVDAWGIDFDKLDNLGELKNTMKIGAEKSGATVLSIQEHQFKPNGVTVLLLLSESHFSIHTYPENGFAGIDIYTCGEHVDPLIAVANLLSYLEPLGISVKEVTRGSNFGITDVYSYSKANGDEEDDE